MTGEKDRSSGGIKRRVKLILGQNPAIWGTLMDFRAVSLVLLYYLRSIPDWGGLLWSRASGKAEILAEKKKVKVQRIALVCQRPRGRESKIACGLKSSGLQVTLLTLTALPPDHDIIPYCDSIKTVSNIFQALKILDKDRPDIVHVFTNGDQIQLFPVVYLSKIKVVYDPYDILRGTETTERFSLFNRLSFLAERKLVEKSASVCCRSLELQILRRRFGYRTADVIYFPDYCWSKPKASEKRFKGNEIQVVYVGGLWPEDKYPAELFGHAQYLDLAEMFKGKGIHFHIYPVYPPNKGLEYDENFKEFYRAYILASKRNRFLHLHRQLTNRELIEVLSQYDIGLLHANLAKKDPINTEDKYRFASANKIFDYIEAGLPVLLHNSFHQRGIARHYGTLITVESFDELMDQLQNIQYKVNGNPFHATLSFHAPRLIRRYSKLVEN